VKGFTSLPNSEIHSKTGGKIPVARLDASQRYRARVQIERADEKAQDLPVRAESNLLESE
jgi:hypothetical protein